MAKIEETLKIIKRMIKAQDSDFLTLASHLSFVREHDFVAFNELLEVPNKKTGVISRRKAYYLLNICDAFSPLMKKDSSLRKRLLAVGWTKLSRISKVKDKDELFNLLSLAEDTQERTMDLERRVGDLEKNTPSALLRGLKKYSVTFHLPERRFKALMLLLEAHGASYVDKKQAVSKHRRMKGKEDALILALNIAA